MSALTLSMESVGTTPAYINCAMRHVFSSSSSLLRLHIEVPSHFIARVDNLFGLHQNALKLVGEGHRPHKDFSRSRNLSLAADKKLPRDTEAFILKRVRYSGLTQAPRSTKELLRSALAELKNIRDSLQHLVDAKRFEVFSPSFRYRIATDFY